MNKFGVFYTCFTEYEAVRHSIEIFRQHYPETPIYLVSDGGLDFKDLELKFNNIHTCLASDSRGLIPKIPENDFTQPEWQKVIKDSIHVFLNRIRDAIHYTKYPEYMLVLEPDVLIRGQINIPSGVKLLGSKINSGFSSSLRALLQNKSGAIDSNRWGAVPPIFHTKTFLSAYEELFFNYLDPGLFDRLCKTDHRLANYDFLLPVMFNLIGEEETFNPEIVECFRNHDWENTTHPIVHQYRAKYPLSTEGYTGTHTNHKHGMGDTWLWKR